MLSGNGARTHRRRHSEAETSLSLVVAADGREDVRVEIL